MRKLNNLEINFISGGESTIVIAGCMAVTAVAVASIIYGAVNYHNSIDFSKLTPEEAYNKGLEDGYGFASLIHL